MLNKNETSFSSVNCLRFVKFEASVSTVGQERMKEARKKDLPLVKMSQTLLTTRRLLYWSYQIGKRQTRSIYTILIKKLKYKNWLPALKKGLPLREHVYIFPAMLHCKC
jgi:hypothetical protein